MTWTGVVRWGLRGVGALVVLVLAWLLVGRIYAARRLDAAREAFKQNVGPLELAAWVSPPVPDEENAAIPIRSGALGLVLSDADRTLIGELMRNTTEATTPEQVTGWRRILETNRAALEAISKGAGLPRSTFGDDLQPGTDSNARLPLVKIMWAGRLLRGQMRVARLDGDRERMLSSIETTFGLARAVHQEPQLISQLISTAGERIALGMVAEVVADRLATDNELRRMEGMLLSNDLQAAWKRTEAVNALMVMADVQRAIPMPASGSAPRQWERVMSFAWGPVSEAVQLELCTEFVRFVDEPAALRAPVPELPKGIDRLRWYLLGFVNPFGVTKDIFRAISIKETINSSARLQATMAQRTLVKLVLTLRLQALVSGSYPPDLSGFPDAAGPDPFTGKPLAYERRADGSAVLAIPDGEALWKQVTGGMPTPCPFSVTLPPPVKARARGAA